MTHKGKPEVEHIYHCLNNSTAKTVCSFLKG
jgi:hypothetical protein